MKREEAAEMSRKEAARILRREGRKLGHLAAAGFIEGFKIGGVGKGKIFNWAGSLFVADVGCELMEFEMASKKIGQIMNKLRELEWLNFKEYTEAFDTGKLIRRYLVILPGGQIEPLAIDSYWSPRIDGLLKQYPAALVLDIVKIAANVYHKVRE